LVMRAISLNLIRGNIDQVTETVRCVPTQEPPRSIQCPCLASAVAHTRACSP
jgi:hypothetical protein